MLTLQITFFVEILTVSHADFLICMFKKQEFSPIVAFILQQRRLTSQSFISNTLI